jgi:hypothetical protein
VSHPSKFHESIDEQVAVPEAAMDEGSPVVEEMGEELAEERRR